MTSKLNSTPESWKQLSRHDLLASFVVFLVALPLCMGIAIASGVPVAAGLITGIVGGLVVGWIAGCPLQVSGPAAGLTVIVYEAVQTYGLQALGVIVLLAGLFQIAAGMLRLGQWFRAVSPAVIKGMLAGIGFLIMASQFHVMIDDKPKGSGAENLVSIPAAVTKTLASPEISDRATRKTRSYALHTIGELHRQQQQLHERLRDIGDRTNSFVSALSPDKLEALKTQQDELSRALAEAITALRNNALPPEDSESNDVILAAATTALNQSEAAGLALETKSVKDAIDSQQDAVMSLETLLERLKNHQLAAYIGIVTILLIVFWQSFVPQKLRVVPAPLVAIGLAAIVAAIVKLPVFYVEAPANLWDDIRFPAWHTLTSSWADLLPVSLLMALVASAETLLCATAVDQIQQGPRTNYDRELLAQGIGNSICGLLGALPMTGVIVRSSANVQAGAQSRLSTVLHGAWLLLFVAALTFVLHSIPTASLAAMLVYTGYKLVDIKSLRELQRYGWGEVAIYAATVATIVFADLLTGVLVGIGLSAGKLLYTFSHLDTGLDIERSNNSAVLKLRGSATFVRLPALAVELERVPKRAELHVDFQHLDYIDHACLDLLMNWAKQHESTGGRLVIDWTSLHARFTGTYDTTRNGRPVQPALNNVGGV